MVWLMRVEPSFIANSPAMGRGPPVFARHAGESRHPSLSQNLDSPHRVKTLAAFMTSIVYKIVHDQLRLNKNIATRSRSFDNDVIVSSNRAGRVPAEQKFR